MKIFIKLIEYLLSTKTFAMVQFFIIRHLRMMIPLLRIRQCLLPSIIFFLLLVRLYLRCLHLFSLKQSIRIAMEFFRRIIFFHSIFSDKVEQKNSLDDRNWHLSKNDCFFFIRKFKTVPIHSKRVKYIFIQKKTN